MTSLIRVAIRPNTDLDRRNCEAGLRRLAAEDPTLVVQAGPGPDAITVGALREVHLEIVMEAHGALVMSHLVQRQARIVSRETQTVNSGSSRWRRCLSYSGTPNT